MTVPFPLGPGFASYICCYITPGSSYAGDKMFGVGIHTDLALLNMHGCEGVRRIR